MTGASARTIDDQLREAAGHLSDGRMAEAAALADAVLAGHPRHAAAHYVRALCGLSEGAFAEALPHAEAALRREPANAQYHFAAALCLGALGRTDEAIAAHRRVLQRRPAHADSLAALGRLLEDAGRVDEALKAYDAALPLRPRDPALLTRAGFCALASGQVAIGLARIEHALALQPDLPAATLRQAGLSLARLGHGAQALPILERALALDPADAEGWARTGELQYLSGNDAAARSCFEKTLALAPGDEDARFLLDVVEGRTIDQPPDGFVARFFDRFAADFDRRLRKDLQYRVPEDLAKLLAPFLEERTGLRVADLGCGTGLCGAWLRPVAARLTGVDLSPAMLEAARAGGLYDELAQEEITKFLSTAPAASFDLLVAADVFIYVGRLERLFTAVAHALAPGGAFAFSVETAKDGEAEVQLRRSGRYAHSVAYVHGVAGVAGLRIEATQEEALRTDAGLPVAGTLFVLRAD